MKRYSKTVIDGRYSEMTEDDLGDWVPAEVAQALYDALTELKSVEESDMVGVEWKLAVREACKKASKALALADGEE